MLAGCLHGRTKTNERTMSEVSSQGVASVSMNGETHRQEVGRYVGRDRSADPIDARTCAWTNGQMDGWMDGHGYLNVSLQRASSSCHESEKIHPNPQHTTPKHRSKCRHDLVVLQSQTQPLHQVLTRRLTARQIAALNIQLRRRTEVLEHSGLSVVDQTPDALGAEDLLHGVSLSDVWRQHRLEQRIAFCCVSRSALRFVVLSSFPECQFCGLALQRHGRLAHTDVLQKRIDV
mmetsp:Transcript_38702/g.96870  ORF Transcript_38702/g.96870 Transcript_38702/m.96870 type:complete len:233 (-) Transcript_38702:214-912(-)